MSQALAKVCRRCGRDVSTEKRVKDVAGRYYCQPCHAAGTATAPATTPTQAIVSPMPSCTGCGSAVAEDAAFCARCGAKQGTNLSVDAEIGLASLIVDLRRYAELSTVLAMAPGVYGQMTQTLRQAAAARDTSGVADLNDLIAQAKVQEASCRREAEELKVRIGAFDRVRVQKVYELIMVNATVPDTIKDGLRSDALNLFGRTAGLQPQSTGVQTPVPSELAHAKQSAAIKRTQDRLAKKRARDKQGRLLIVPTLGVLALMLAVGMGADQTGSPGQFVAAVLLGLGAAATILASIIVAVMRKLRGTSHEAAADGPPMPVGIWICGGLLLVAILCFTVAAFDFSQTPVLTTFAVKTACVGIGALIAAFIGFANACPKCHLLFTSEVLNTDSLGTHTESRPEQRTARHYPAGGGPAYGETKYEVERQVQVTTLVHTKHCKSCGHIWLASERREN